MKRLLFFLLILLVYQVSYSQIIGDYQTKPDATKWSEVSSWQVYDGNTWTGATTVPTKSLATKPSKITITAPAISGNIFYLDLGRYIVDLPTTDLYINDGATFQHGTDQSFTAYINIRNVIISAGGMYTVPTTNLLSTDQVANDNNGGARNQLFYIQGSLAVSEVNGTINPKPGKFIGIHTFSHTPDANGTLTSYTQRLAGHTGRGTHPATSANVIYPPDRGLPVEKSWTHKGEMYYSTATFNFKPMFIIGSTLAACDVVILDDGGDAIIERGICYGLEANPTIDDHKVAQAGATGTGSFRLQLQGLTEKTDYHVRAYAVSSKGVSYSDDVTFKTIAKGKLTYTFNKSASPSATELAAYDRLQTAIDGAQFLLENYTSITKHVTINYVPSVPTADASSSGWMRFGSNAGYQNKRTMLHEINHALGTGTTSWWNSIRSGGKYQGVNANMMLNLIQNTTGAQINGDNFHWWPHGLNQNSEVSSEWSYVYNCLIIEAMRKDGLPASGPYNP